jgi:hypothetical protein
LLLHSLNKEARRNKPHDPNNKIVAPKPYISQSHFCV